MKAHIGLEKNLVEGKIGGDELRIRYRLKTDRGGKCWNEIVKLLSGKDF